MKYLAKIISYSHTPQNYINNGFVSIIATILIVVGMVAVGISMAEIIISEHKISANAIESTKSYFPTESGIEDVLLRLRKNMDLTTTSTLNTGGASVITNISESIGGAITITAQGNFKNATRKIATVYEISDEGTTFFYGAQIGEGGIIMENSSIIYGNIFSGGSITGEPDTNITGTVKVAKTGNKIYATKIGEAVYVDICEDSEILGTLFSNSSINCTASSYEILGEEIESVPLPISQTQIDKWKSDALLGGTIDDFILSGKDIVNLGPKKIDGDVIIEDKAELIVNGTLWITGNFTVKNLSSVTLNKDIYHSLSGIIIVDGITSLQNLAEAVGTGEPGSYLLILSTNNNNPSITIQNSFEADLLYAQNGWVEVKNLAFVREITGYGLRLSNLAEIKYEIGIQDPLFSSGPGGAWRVADWREIK